MSQTASDFLVQRLYDWGVPGEVGVCLAVSTRVGVLPGSTRVHHGRLQCARAVTLLPAPRV